MVAVCRQVVIESSAVTISVKMIICVSICDHTLTHLSLYDIVFVCAQRVSGRC